VHEGKLAVAKPTRTARPNNLWIFAVLEPISRARNQLLFKHARKLKQTHRRLSESERLAQNCTRWCVTAAIIGLGHDLGQIRKRGLGWSPNLGAGGQRRSTLREIGSGARANNSGRYAVAAARGTPG
jgi:hypothetical protein